MARKRLIDSIELPAGLKALSIRKMTQLAAEIRQTILEVVPKTGGHLASNLGVVELTLALHYVYDFPRDMLIFDTGHQSYAHKIITGRLDRFSTLRQKDGLLGFPSPWESEYDPFITGHAGTSISTAMGAALGYEAAGRNDKVVAVIGDGAFCGLSFEALNHGGELKKNMLVVLNDNRMAISPTVGAFSRHLNRLRSYEYYQRYREDVRQGLARVPVVGDKLKRIQEMVFDLLRTNLVPGLIFKELGFEYYGPINGHNLDDLVTMIRNLRNTRGPLLLHVFTEKGMGMPEAEKDPLKYHGVAKLSSLEKKKKEGISYSRLFSELLAEEARKDKRIFAITAAMAQGTSLESFMKEFPGRAVDTGIAESHAVTMAGAMEAVGMKPVVLIYSTFLQRAYDQIMHDLCLQKSGAVILAIDRAGVVSGDGPSHHGTFDIAYLRHLPRMTLMAPSDGPELRMMLKWALSCPDPVAIRYPRDPVPKLDLPDKRPVIEPGVPELLAEGTEVAILAYGAMVEHSLKAAEILRERGISPTIVNLRFAKPMSARHFAPILSAHRWIFTVEDHAVAGGVGSALLEMIADNGLCTGRVVRLGIPDFFAPHAERGELLAMLGLDAPGIAGSVIGRMRENGRQEDGARS